ncbi:Site-specific recombinase XerD [Ferrimonas sediminum]|uniref:Site-specific recombinase XerD n=1 Tax=Ferrimonas sediminum TaxID=718193 RepID=A0A1G8Y9M4_9GAMM|nr:site-specific integrase [Ferrimonas sediminum]SDJ99589.1 Site-specific recombinase XerD [Ferrimonas sediminum]
MQKRHLNFTKKALEQLEPEPRRYRVYDRDGYESLPGLVLVVMANGKKMFRYRRKLKGKDLEVTIGQFPATTIDTARRVARELANEVSQGQNPNSRKRQEREQEKFALTIGELYKAYIAEFELRIRTGERRPKSLQDVKYNWNKHLRARFENVKAEDLTEDHAKQFLRALMAKHSPWVYNKCLTVLKSLFSELEHQPLRRIKKIPNTKRERVLNREELDRLFEAMKPEPQIYQDVVMVLLLTGQRKSCVFSMEWTEIDHHNKVWLIPIGKMKAKRAHAVPLTDKVMEILKRRSAEAEPNQPYVFPSDRAGSGHIVEKTGKLGFWHRITTRAGLRSEDRNHTVTIHDLRRTIATWNIVRGGTLQASSKLLGHSDLSITASTYAHLQLDQVRQELSLLSNDMVGSRNQDVPTKVLSEELRNLSREEKVVLIAELGRSLM